MGIGPYGGHLFLITYYLLLLTYYFSLLPGTADDRDFLQGFVGPGGDQVPAAPVGLCDIGDGSRCHVLMLTYVSQRTVPDDTLC